MDDIESVLENCSLRDDRVIHVEDDNCISVRESIWGSTEVLRVVDSERDGKLADYVKIIEGGDPAQYSYDKEDFLELVDLLKEEDILVEDEDYDVEADIGIINRVEGVSLGIGKNTSIESIEELEEDIDHIVLVTQDIRKEDVRELNRKSMEESFSFTLVMMERKSAYIISIDTPETPCLECLESRINASVSPGREVTGREPASSIEKIVSGYLEEEVGKGLKNGFDSKLKEISLDTQEFRTHRVFKVPRCPVCGEDKPAQNFLNFESLEALYDEDKEQE